jgi:tetratricopeptide (TPR) repeat protein
MMLITTGQRMLILVAILFAAACATAPSKNAPLPSPKDTAIKRAHDSLVRGDFEQALALYAETYRKYREKDLRDKYLQAGNEIRSDADVAFQMADYGKAGSGYKALLDSMITSEDTGNVLSFDEDYLRKHIKECGDRLTEKGLLLYRQQHLDEAIATWKKVLIFDPTNKTVAQHIDTANRQLRNLKSINE